MPKSLPTNNIFNNKPAATNEIISSNKKTTGVISNTQTKETIIASKKEVEIPKKNEITTPI